MNYLVAPDRHVADGFVLRSYFPGDGAALREAAVSSYAHLAPWMPWASASQTLEESEELARRFRARYLLAEEFVLAVVTPDDGTILGGAGFHLREGPLSTLCAEVGMWIRASHAGRGLGTRVLCELLAWGFDAWPWKRLAWRCDALNAGSVRTAERAGMTREGVLRGQPAEVGDRRRDTVCFAALRAEWSRPR